MMRAKKTNLLKMKNKLAFIHMANEKLLKCHADV